MVVIETKSEIEEMNGHNIVTEQHKQITRRFQNSKYIDDYFLSISLIYYFLIKK